jgi:hypothetical protein
MCELIRQGKKVGVTACSHRVIRNLLDEVILAAAEEKVTPLVCLHKVTDRSDEALPPGIVETMSNADALTALQSGSAQVVVGPARTSSNRLMFCS